jgi:hypothetical protein
VHGNGDGVRTGRMIFKSDLQIAACSWSNKTQEGEEQWPGRFTLSGIKVVGFIERMFDGVGKAW